MIPTKRLKSRMNSSRFNPFLFSTSYCFSIQFFHLRTEAAEDDLLDFLRREVADRFHGNRGSSFPGVSIDARGNSGEGDRLASIFFSQVEATSVARLQKLRFTMQAILINRTRSMNDEPCRKLETRSDFSLSRLATVQGNTGPQEFRTSRPVNRPVDTATTQQRTIRRIHNRIDLQLGNVTLNNFNLDHRNL